MARTYKIARLKKINIMSTVYKVIFSNTRKGMDPADPEQVYDGMYDPDDATITVYDGGGTRNEAETIKTLFHEMLHAIQDDMGVKLGHKDLDRISVCLADTLIRNGLLSK